MSTELTPVDTYHATTTAPADGDPANGATFQAGLQDLADNAAYLNARRAELNVIRGQFALYKLSGTITDTDDVTLTELSDPSSSYTIVGGDHLQVPAAGTYRFSVGIKLKNTDSGAGLSIRTHLRVNDANDVKGYAAFATRANDDVDEYAEAYFSGITTITTPASELISIYAGASTSTSELDPSGGLNYSWLCIERIA